MSSCAGGAQKLQVVALGKLAHDLGLPLFQADIEEFLVENPALGADAALLTWVLELFRRSHFTGQGEPVLALWREFAWENGRPVKTFEPTVQRVLAAEKRIAGAMQAWRQR